MFNKRTVAFLAAFAMAVPTAALPWRAWNRAEVLPVSEGVWEVVPRRSASPKDYWCGIGDFATSQLRIGATQRIYIWKPVGQSVNRPGERAVQFALQPPEGADTSVGYTIDIKRPGDNMTRAMAQNFCYDRVAEEEMLLPT